MKNKKQKVVLAGIAMVLALLSGGAGAQDPSLSSPKFAIQRYAISGNSLLPNEELERVVAPYTGKQKDFADIQRALEALENAYRARGYGVVRVVLPEQDVTNGVVQFRVVEARVGKVTVEGNTHFDLANVRNSLPTVKEGGTPNTHDIARNLQILSEHPVKQTNVLLRSGNKEDEVDVNVKVEDSKPWRAILSLDDTGTSETGYLRSGIGFQHTNLFNRDDTLTAQYVTSPTNESAVRIYGVGYRMPFYNLNSSLDLIAGHSDTDSGTVQGLFNVSGSGDILGARWNYYLPRWGEVEQKLSFGLDYRAFKNQVLIANEGLVPDITVHPASLGYSGLLRMAAGELGFYAALSANIPGGNDGTDQDFKNSRYGATASYRILRFGANYVHAFRNEWQARAVFNAQYSNDALVSGEQFGVGGPDSVRGYLLREAASDRGYAGQLEIYTPDLSSKIGMSDKYRTRLLGFYDFAAVERNDPLPGELTRASLASTGVGVRFGFKPNISLRFDVARILQSVGTRETGDYRVSSALALVF